MEECTKPLAGVYKRVELINGGKREGTATAVCRGLLSTAGANPFPSPSLNPFDEM